MFSKPFELEFISTSLMLRTSLSKTRGITSLDFLRSPVLTMALLKLTGPNFSTPCSLTTPPIISTITSSRASRIGASDSE